MLIRFKPAPQVRRVIGVLPMPDGARRAFQGASVAQVLRQWQEAMICADSRANVPVWIWDAGGR